MSLAPSLSPKLNRDAKQEENNNGTKERPAPSGNLRPNSFVPHAHWVRTRGRADKRRMGVTAYTVAFLPSVVPFRTVVHPDQRSTREDRGWFSNFRLQESFRSAPVHIS